MEIATLYISAQGARLARIGERLVARSKDGAVIHDVPFFKIRQVICFGSVEISSAAINQLIQRNIDVVYLTLTGRFKCRLSNLNEKSVITRTMQYRRSFEDTFRLQMGRAIVRGKLLNYRSWVNSRQRKGGIESAAELAAINEAIGLVDQSENADELMGLEGTGTRAYFEVFRRNLRQDLGFNERNRRPPRDPVNAMLSFGYTILLHKVLAAIETAGVDPFMANLHANQNGRPSLALDLMEEFRLFIVDAVVARLVNLVQVKPGDFIVTADQGVKMQPATIALLVRELQARLSACFPYARDGRKLQLQDQIIRQAYHYRDVVCGESERYLPVFFPW